jgi:hypothetical protein
MPVVFPQAGCPLCHRLLCLHLLSPHLLLSLLSLHLLMYLLMYLHRLLPSPHRL